MPTDLTEIARLIETQDNAGTAHPIFVVQELEKITGLDANYVTDCEWVELDGGDYDVATPEEAAALDLREAAGEDTSPWEKFGYALRWEFVTACFTRQGCKDYIQSHAHRHRSRLDIYVDSAYRNAEYQAVRVAICAMAAKAERIAELEEKMAHSDRIRAAAKLVVKTFGIEGSIIQLMNALKAEDHGEDTCTWHTTDPTETEWHGCAVSPWDACGDCTPKGAGMVFCPFCGKRLVLQDDTPQEAPHE